MRESELVGLARDASGKAISPFSGFRVGAALLSSEGQLFVGCNIENASLSMSVCAEQVVMLKALSEGARKFDSIAVWADVDSYVTPCGKCRQLLFEFAPNIQVIMANREGKFLARRIEELLPMPFRHRVL